MADQNTTNYSFIKPEIGASEDTWGEKLNDNWDSADTEIKALEDSKVNNTGDETIAGVKTFSDGIVSNVTGNVIGNVTGDLTGDAATLNGLTAAQIIPSGLISMWSGTNANIPSGWALCNGANGTPDLGDRFIMGDTADARGANGSSHTATTSSNGAHSHGGSTASHTLTIAQIPAHGHSINTRYGTVNNGLSGTDVPNQVSAADIEAQYSRLSTGAVQSAGGNEGHSHSIGSDGSHNHTVDTRGKYYKLAFIMKL